MNALCNWDRLVQVRSIHMCCEQGLKPSLRPIFDDSRPDHYMGSVQSSTIILDRRRLSSVAIVYRPRRPTPSHSSLHLLQRFYLLAAPQFYLSCGREVFVAPHSLFVLSSPANTTKERKASCFSPAFVRCLCALMPTIQPTEQIRC